MHWLQATDSTGEVGEIGRVCGAWRGNFAPSAAGERETDPTVRGGRPGRGDRSVEGIGQVVKDRRFPISEHREARETEFQGLPGARARRASFGALPVPIVPERVVSGGVRERWIWGVSDLRVNGLRGILFSCDSGSGGERFRGGGTRVGGGVDAWDDGDGIGAHRLAGEGANYRSRRRDLSCLRKARTSRMAWSLATERDRPTPRAGIGASKIWPAERQYPLPSSMRRISPPGL